MMKYLTMFVLSLTVLLFAACSSGGGEPTVAPEATETMPALTTAVSTPALESYPANAPAAAPVESYPGAATTVEPYNPYPGQAAESGAEITTSSAYPVTVDLSDITSEPESSTPQEMPKPGVPDTSTAVIQEVSQDLATRLGIDISEVTAVETDSVEWPDSALGCPADGFAYAQVITPGFMIALEASGKPYNYHTDLNGNFVLCDENGSPVNE